MLLAGDEFGRTQHGNNNAYCQDNEISWLDWHQDHRRGAEPARIHAQADRSAQGLPDPAPQPLPDRLVQRGARRQGRHLAQRRRRRDDDRSTGTTATPAASACCSTAARRRPASSGADRTRRCCSIFNAHHDVVKFTLPDVAEGRDWVRLIDTTQPETALATHPFGHVYDVTGRSLCAFALEGAATRDLRQGVGSILDATERPLEIPALRASRLATDSRPGRSIGSYSVTTILPRCLLASMCSNALPISANG